MSRVLVCGGRDYENRTMVYHWLDSMHSRICITQIIEGGAKGADRLALDWAILRGVEVHTFCADWDIHGKAAGHIRNQKMLDDGKPDMVIAFPGGAGTANMIRLARKAGIPVITTDTKANQ
jgi:hypothetical protein